MRNTDPPPQESEHYKMSLKVILENVHAEQFCSGSRRDGLDVNLLWVSSISSFYENSHHSVEIW